MNRHVGCAFALFLPGLFAIAYQVQGARGDADWRAVATWNGWMLNYDEARRKAVNTRKPLMVVFRCVP